ncbi:MAG: serine hydrolase [Caulobacteraceae bacterium]|nr:serine hydrolase [Caulobacteraceae bacterium]
MRLIKRSALALALSAGMFATSGVGLAQTDLKTAPAPPPAPARSAPSTPAAHLAKPSSETLARTAAAQAPAAPLDQRLAPGEAIPRAVLEAYVDGAVRNAMTHDHIAGVSVAIVQNGQVVLTKGYGFARPGRPVDPDRTLFRLGSISKTFTWIALMKDAEAGRIRLDAPINLFLPEKLQIHDQGFKRPILVRDLMTHTPGFEDRVLGQLFEQDPARVRPLVEYLRQETPRRVREAGSLPVYSNYGAALAGEAISYVNGHPYQDLIEAEILRPLSLTHTTFREPYPPRADLPAPMAASLEADLSDGYRWAAGGFRPQPFVYVSQAAPAGAGSSSAGDMARYMLAILGGGQLEGVTLYNADTARGFRTLLQAPAPGLNGWDNGFHDAALPGGWRGQGHDGDALWFRANMVTVPGLNLGVFVATNTNTGGDLAESLPEQIVGRFYAPAPAAPRGGSPELAASPSAYAGTYLNDRRPYGGLGKFAFMLISQLKVSVTPDGRLLTHGAQTQAWVPEGPAGHFVEADGLKTSAFEIQDGRAERWLDPSGATAYDRVSFLSQVPTLVVLAVLTAIAAIATLFGQFTRDPREFRQTSSQGRANLLQTTISVLWLIAFVAVGIWGLRARDIDNVIFHWPGPFLLIASACAFVAATLTLLTVAMEPLIWRGGRRLDSWSAGRKLRFTATTLIYSAFSVVLGLWGALEPWSR